MSSIRTQADKRHDAAHLRDRILILSVIERQHGERLHSASLGARVAGLHQSQQWPDATGLCDHVLLVPGHNRPKELGRDAGARHYEAILVENGFLSLLVAAHKLVKLCLRELCL